VPGCGFATSTIVGGCTAGTPFALGGSGWRWVVGGWDVAVGWPLVEGVTDGAGGFEVDVVDGFGECRLGGTMTTGVPPAFGATRNCESGLPACVVAGATALDPIATTLTVAAVVTPTSRPAAMIVLVVVVAASAVGKCNAASFTVAHLPDRPFGRVL